MSVKAKLITNENVEELSKWYHFGLKYFKGWVGFYLLLAHGEPTVYFKGLVEDLEKMYEKVEELEDGWSVYKRKEYLTL